MIEIIRDEIARLQDHFEALPTKECAASRRRIGRQLVELVGLLEDVEREEARSCAAGLRQGLGREE